MPNQPLWFEIPIIFIFGNYSLRSATYIWVSFSAYLMYLLRFCIKFVFSSRRNVLVRRSFSRISNIHYLVNLALVPNRKRLFAVMDMQFTFLCRNEHLYAQWFPLFYWIDSAYFGNTNENHKILKSRSIQYILNLYLFSLSGERENKGDVLDVRKINFPRINLASLPIKCYDYFFSINLTFFSLTNSVEWRKNSKRVLTCNWKK